MTTPTKYLATTTAVTIHREGDNFCFGEDATTLQMVDECAGAFFLLSQEGREPLRMDLQELELLAVKAKELLTQPGVESEP